MTKYVNFGVAVGNAIDELKKVASLTVDTIENNGVEIRNLEKIDLQIEEVNNYINDNLLYFEERIQNKMDEKRFLHSLNVGKVAYDLANINGIDKKVAFNAGVLHDIAKRFDKEILKKYLLEFNKDLFNEPEAV
ncbi:hypothetical protein FQR65_LT16616 [Abscondita terminalis]|nr:hypothetical protein FQR65_LT16616 [Abscondita terminalis]